jgi:DNA-binding beta-propeller fold protein YncE
MLALLVAIAVNAASAAPKSSDDESLPPVFYPPAPNFPRIQYLTKFSSAYDVSAKSGGFRDFVFGGEAAEEQAIVKPFGVAIHDGSIFAVDTRGFGYVVFDFINGKWRLVKGQGDGNMPKPINITIDEDGTRYVTDTVRNLVIVFDKNDRFIRTLGSTGQFRPADTAISGNRLYVSDVEHHKIQVLDKFSGETLFEFGEPGPEAGQFVHPTSLAIGPDGAVFVSDTTNFRIQKFSADGEFLRVFGSVGTGIGHFARPKGLDVDKEGRLYVVDAAFQNVQIFDEDGNVLMFFGGGGIDRGDMYLPTVVKVDYENVEFFRQYAAPGFEIEYLLLVASQYGTNKVSVYGFGELKD